jgi:hypothetical protein
MNKARWASMRLLVLSLLVICFSVALADSVEVSTQTEKRLESSVFPVVCAMPNGWIYGTAGTGFFVNHGDFITPRHVIKQVDDWHDSTNTCNAAIYVPGDNWDLQRSNDALHSESLEFSTYFATCEKDQLQDIALCHTTWPNNPFYDPTVHVHAVAFQMSPQHPGDEIALTGFLEAKISKAYTFPTDSRGSLIGYVPGYVLINAPGGHGESGSPVYTNDGKVLGMFEGLCKAIISGLTLIAPCATTPGVIKDFLDRYNVKANYDK